MMNVINRHQFTTIRMAVLLAALAVLLSPIRLHAGEETYTYGASPYTNRVENRDLVVKFGLRLKGDAHPVAVFRFPASSKWRSFFEEQIQKGDFLYSYFEIKTNQEILPPRPTVLAHLDIVTEEVLKDMAENSRMHPDDGILRPLPDSAFVSVRMITQNEFLGVNPRIIPVPPAP
jgi:hypothetical protein